MKKSPLKIFALFVAAFVVLWIVGPVGYILFKTKESVRNMKPYISYVRVNNLLAGCEDYKKQYGEWPSNIDLLVQWRPDLANDTGDDYGHSVVLTPYVQSSGYGEIISYGRDGKPGGDNRFDQDILVRFPVETETNTQWNKKVDDLFTNRTARGLW